MASAAGSSAEEDVVAEAARARAGSYNSPTTMWQHQQHEQYHDAAHQEHKQATSTSHTPQLPPIQHFEGQTMQPQPMYASVAINGQIAPPPPPPSHHHPPPPPPAQYHPAQYHYSNGLPPAMPSNGGVNGRYPLPPHVINAPRQKKDIKRRTKTGCLTCRKRRIKCDEGHPLCRNCQKSKRECLGYDPIFKQQPGPPLIQPAPSAYPALKAESSPEDTAVQHHSNRHSHPYAPSEDTFVAANHPHRGDGRFVAPVDPALAGGEPSLNMAPNSFSTTLRPERRVRPLHINQLFSLNDVPPRYQHHDEPPPNSNALQQEADEFYRHHFAPGLDKLFETTWYSERGGHYLQRDRPLLDYTMQVIERMRPRADDHPSVQDIQSLEARLVWQLAAMPRTIPPEANGAAVDPLTTEILARVYTLENVLTGQFLPPSHIPQPPSPSEQQPDHRKYNEQRFWHLFGRFAAARDDTPDPNVAREIVDTLAAMRGSLGMLENRDVLYSLAVARHIGGRLVEFHPPRPVIPQTDEPNDDVKKLAVAQLFISQEDQKGTTQVIQRVCSMAMRSWILQRQE